MEVVSNQLMEPALDQYYQLLKVCNTYTYMYIVWGYDHPDLFVSPVRPGELLPAITDAKSSGGGGAGDTKVVRILAGAMKQLKHSRLKPDPKLNSDLITLVKEDPQIFNNPTIIEVCVGACVHTKKTALTHGILKSGHTKIEFRTR